MKATSPAQRISSSVTALVVVVLFLLSCRNDNFRVEGFFVPTSLTPPSSKKTSHSFSTTLTAQCFLSQGSRKQSTNKVRKLPKWAKKSSIVEEDDNSWTDFGKSRLSYVYLGSWLALVSFAFGWAPGELNSASDTALLQSILDDPTHPGLMNPIYYGIFNLFVLIPVVLAATIAPRAYQRGGIPAGPPLFLATFIAYFVMGPYLAFRKTPKSAPIQEVGWLTKNVWENKLFNYATAALGVLCLASGLVPGLTEGDVSANVRGFVDLISTSRFASVSLADLSLITLILTKEVADDYTIRCGRDRSDDEDAATHKRAKWIGASTAFLPILGTAIYLVLRPPLPILTQDEEDI